MFVTVVAVMCHLLLSGVEACEETIVTDSAQTEGLTFMDCMAGAQAPLAEWKSAHHTYAASEWRIDRYRCVAGHYEIRGRA